MAAEFEIVPAALVPLAEQARVANEAFAGYVGGWSEIDAESLTRFFFSQGTDLFFSRFVQARDGLAGFGYINRTANLVRLSGMAIIPSARGSGAADHLLQHLLDEAKTNGNEAMMLEVIEQNPRAHAFYKRHGFRELSRLLGWRLKPGNRAARSKETIDELPMLDALQIPGTQNYPAIPWQISQHAMAKVANARAFRCRGTCVIISEPDASSLRLCGLLSAAGEWEEARSAVEAVAAAFSDREFVASAVWPEEFGKRLFEPTGFVREPLTQFLMRRDL